MIRDIPRNSKGPWDSQYPSKFIGTMGYAIYLEIRRDLGIRDIPQDSKEPEGIAISLESQRNLGDSRFLPRFKGPGGFAISLETQRSLYSQCDSGLYTSNYSGLYTSNNSGLYTSKYQILERLIV